MRLPQLVKYIACVLLFCHWGCLDKTSNTERLLKHFICNQEEKARLIHKKMNEAIWLTYTNPEKSDSLGHYYQAIQRREGALQELRSGIVHLYRDFSEYKFLKGVQASGVVKNKTLIRQADKILKLFEDSRFGHDSLELAKSQFHQHCLSKCPVQYGECDWRQNDSIFNKYKAHIGEIHNELRQLLSAYNGFAKKIGYTNYFELILHRNQIDASHYQKMLTRIEQITRSDYLELKHCAERFWMDSLNTTVSELNLFHYNDYFSRLKRPGNWKLDCSKEEIERRIAGFLKDFNFDLTAFGDQCTFQNNKELPRQVLVLNCDNYYDIRGYCNMPYNIDGLLLFLRESSYAVAAYAVDESVPYFLRDPNALLVESVTSYFENLPFQSEQNREKLGLPEPEFDSLVSFSNPWFLFNLRNVMIMAEMEQEMYRNPNRNLTELFWQKVEKYLCISVPAHLRHAEWVKNERLITFNGANQLSLYGMVLAAQYHHLSQRSTEFSDSFPNRIFTHGDDQPWYEMVEQLCGEPLNPAYLPTFYKKH